MKKYLVTGAAGFIGTNFVRQLVQECADIQVVAFDQLTYAGNLENLEGLLKHPRFQFVKGDICDAKAVESVLAGGIDVVVHFAAESHVDRSIMGCQEFIRTNVAGTQVLLDGARAHKVGLYLQVSTDEVYGSLGPTGFFTEQTPLHPHRRLNTPSSSRRAAHRVDTRCSPSRQHSHRPMWY